MHLAQLLQEVRMLTRENVERKLARTATELEEEDEEETAALEGDDDNDEEEEEENSDLPYNPKGLPLGWDGKVRRIVCVCVGVCVC
jgi:splicing factor 3A subunit 3